MAKVKATKGYFKNGVPYARFGNGLQNFIIFNGLDLRHEPPSGLQLRMVMNSFLCLTKDYTVYLINRKHELPSAYSIKDMSEDYATLIMDELGGPVDILGVSAGGVIASRFAIDHPDLVRHLIVTGVAHRLDDEARELMIRVRDLARHGKGRAVCTTIIGRASTHRVKKYLLKSLMWLLPSLMFSSTTGPSDGVVEIEAILNSDFAEQLANIKIPTLVAGGDQDFFAPAVLISETADRIPNAKLILYQGLGHDAASSKQLVDDVLAFLTKSNT
jgi:pimeloyl-ACP methyl ester carboxylesterase